VLALLAGPASYSIATVGKSLTGGNPLAGPRSAESFSGFGGGPGGRAFGKLGTGPGARPGDTSGGGPIGGPAGRPGAGFGASANQAGAPPAFMSRGSGLPAGAPPVGSGPRAGNGGPIAAGGAPGAATVSKTLTNYLKAHQGSSKYLLAAVGSGTAGTIALQTGRNVINMGGFMGSDPAPSLAKLKQLINSGQLHYVLLDSGMGGGLGGPPGGGGRGGSSAATQARDAWIKSHGNVIKLAGQSTATGAATLYYIGSAA